VGDPGLRLKAMRWLALSQGRAARLLGEEGAGNAARARWLHLASMASPHVSQLDADALAWLARAEDAIGHSPAAARLRQRLREGGYRHPDFQSTTKAVARSNGQESAS